MSNKALKDVHSKLLALPFDARVAALCYDKGHKRRVIDIATYVTLIETKLREAGHECSAEEIVAAAVDLKFHWGI